MDFEVQQLRYGLWGHDVEGEEYCNLQLTVKSDLTFKVFSLTVDEAWIKKYPILYDRNTAWKLVMLITSSYRFMLSRTIFFFGREDNISLGMSIEDIILLWLLVFHLLLR